MSFSIRQVSAADPDFRACLAIRQAVFVDEQNVPADEERDEYDRTALHFLALVDEQPAGTARAVRLADALKIGRVAVLKPMRGLGIGAALLRHVEASVPAARLRLDAQVQALAFYEALGYVAQGPEFLDANIPHRRMEKILTGR